VPGFSTIGSSLQDVVKDDFFSKIRRKLQKIADEIDINEIQEEFE
jgi:hypothetical protein